MKTLKRILIFLALISAGNSFGQTKEETITWLKEKLEKYIIGNWQVEEYSRISEVKVVSIDECQIVLTYTETVNQYNIYKNKMVIPTEIKYISNKTIPYEEYEGSIYFASKVVAVSINEGNWNYYDFTPSIRIDMREENIYQRIEKAFKHLATFCEKKIETF